MGRVTSYRAIDERYPTLRIISVICTAIGGILLVLGSALLAAGFYGFLAGMTSGPHGGAGPIAVSPAKGLPLGYGLVGSLSIVWSLGCLVSGLQFLGMGTLFRLAIHVEENTRAAAQCLEKIRTRLEPRDENVGPSFIS